MLSGCNAWNAWYGTAPKRGGMAGSRVVCRSITQTHSAERRAEALWKVPALPEKQQELILNRAIELMNESGKWQGYPLQSIEYDEERKQWRLAFSSGQPDAGYHVFISDAKAERIDVLLFPPMWTEYERKKTSNQ